MKRIVASRADGGAGGVAAEGRGAPSTDQLLQFHRRHLPEHDEGERHPSASDHTVRQVLRPVPALRESSRWLQGVSRLRDPGIGVALRLIRPVGRPLPAQGPRSIHGVVVDRWAGGGTGAGVPQAGRGLTRVAPVRSGSDVRADPSLAESRLVHRVRDPRDDAARDGARRDQPLAGLPRLRGARGGQGGRPEGDRRRHQPVPDHVGRRGVPRGDRPELSRAVRDDVGRGRSATSPSRAARPRR